ncbi:Calx-beta domain-containing protein [Limnoraphis robusta]|uniref:Calx-beta domain-containing protein n=1 Tax=Limnoraphis robusta CCNP1315 TaxID=3110306 RepID=A0ABU5TUN5_9CYAN|nr:Calx-beta domain-containing protein [Limnoraphis robusta]MEA5518253.1 Calx-beta domain-containing protein [Limnoraphis robusta CCNP1315]MEA5547453.1 Calx-beta domain-containing protein [Limnoraphis robusta CCNP1324]
MANIIGAEDPDLLEGTLEADLIQGLAGDDTLIGFLGNDTLQGNSDNDSILGSRDDDLLQGDEGNDSLFGEFGNDTVEGGLGDDFLFGNEGDDFISDIGGSDTLYGGQGNDTLVNLEGNDQLFGDLDNDILYTGLGLNTLTGGAGADLFVIGRSLNGGLTDIITDFRAGFDLIALTDDLEFEDLEFVQTGNDTTIIDRESREELAILQATQRNTLIRSNFTKSISTITSVVEFSEQSIQIRENQTSAFVEIGIQRTGSPLNTVGGKLLLSEANSSSDDLDLSPEGIEVIFAPFETFKRVTIPINNDDQFEGDESISLRLTDPIGGATIGEQSEFIVNIEDDERPPTPTPTPTPTPDDDTLTIPPTPPITASTVSVSVSPTNVPEDQGQGLVYTFSRSSGSLLTGIIVDFAIAGSAELGTDYTVTGALEFSDGEGTIVFAPNESTTQITLTPVANDIFEADKTIELTIAESGTLYEADPARQSATGTIVNDDDPPDPPVYDFSKAEFIGVEGDPDNRQRVEIIVSRSADVDLESQVDIILTDGTAIEGTDYQTPPLPTPLIFLPGETEKSVFVDLIPNTEEQLSRSLNLSFDNFQIIADGNPIIGGQAGVNNPAATITINDDDGATTYEFNNSLFTTSEGDVLNTVDDVVEIIRTGRLDPSSVTVNLQGINNALPGVDFAAGPITVDFAANQTLATVPIEIIGNVIPQRNKTVRLSLAPSTGQQVGTENPTANLIIVDDDDIPTYDFTTSQYTASEDDGITEVVTVLRSGNAEAASSVDVVLTTAASDGAIPGEDITPERITVNFAPGETTQTIPLEIIDDTIEEEAEAVNLRFENFAPLGQTGNTFPTANLLILDNDSPPVYNFSLANFSTVEGTVEGNVVNQTTVVEVSRSGETTNASRVDVVLTQGTAAAGTDYVNGPITIEFAPGETTQFVPIQIVGDDRVENDETLGLSFDNFIIIGNNGQAIEGGRAGTSQPQSVLTIENDDTARVSIIATEREAVEADPSRKIEAKNGIFRIDRTPDPVGELTVNLTVSGNKLLLTQPEFELKIGEDTVEIVVDPETNTPTATVTLPNQAASLDITLVPRDDDQAEADESLTLTIAEIDNSEYVIDSEDNEATVTLLANDTQVTRLTDSNATDEQAYFDAVEGSLRQALINAEAFAGDNTITFAPQADGVNTIDLVAALPNINSDGLTLNGNNVPGLTVQRSAAEGTPNFRIFTVNGGNFTLSNLTLANGIAPRANLGDTSSPSTPENRGGAISISGGTVEIVNTVIEGSQANNGGAIANAGTLKIDNSTIRDNTAINGAGIAIIDGGVSVTNSTIADNDALRIGGGAFLSFGELTVTNSTIARNTALLDGGGVGGNFTTGRLNLKNTIIAANIAPSGEDISSAPETFPVNSSGNNLIGNATDTAGFNPANGDIIGTSDSPVDALLVPGFNTEGLTPTIALLPESPAIDVGNGDFTAPYTGPGPFDQRGDGFPRIVDVIDIGAFEFQG